MPSEKQAKKSVQTLRRLQGDHKKKLKQLEKARRKFEKRRQQMTALEIRIANLEYRVSGLESENGHGPMLGSKELKSARVILNLNAASNGNGENKVEKLIDTLRLHGIRAEICLKTSGKVARRCARQAVKKNEELLIVAAGDGTIEDVASQLVGTKTALGIVPLGTMNNVARSLGIPPALEDACALIGAGITRQIDIGHVREGEKPEIRYFLETAGLGLTGIAFPAGQAAEKREWGKLPDVIGRLFDLKPAPVEIELDDGEIIRANSQLVTVSNAPLTGANFLIAPDAKMDDGLFDIAVYDGMGKTEIMSYWMQMTDGKRADNPKVRYYRARHVVIRSSRAMPAVSDKDAIPEHQVLDINLVPHALTAIAGKGIGLSLPVQAVAAVPPVGAGQEQTNKGSEAI